MIQRIPSPIHRTGRGHPRPGRTPARLLRFAAAASLLVGLGLGTSSAGRQGPGTAQAQSPASDNLLIEQVLSLRPGWNAVFVELQPDEAELDAVLAGVVDRIDRVAQWVPNVSPDFIRDPQTIVPDGRTWLAYFPPASPHRPLSDLLEVSAHQAYLIKVTPGAPVSLTIRGRPSVEPLSWVADSFNLVGFPLDPEAPPTFDDYFAPAVAHRGQAIYRMGADDTWHPVAPSDAMAPGEAYWVYSAGVSEYTAPLDLELELGSSGIDFFDTGMTASMRLAALHEDATSAVAVDVTIETLPSTEPVTLDYERLVTPAEDPSLIEGGRYELDPLPSPHTLTLAPDEPVDFVTLGVDRSGFEGEGASVLELRDGRGTRYQIPVTASGGTGGGPDAPSPFAALLDAINPMAPQQLVDVSLPAGLWVGYVVVDRVREIHKPRPTAGAGPTPTPGLPECTSGIDERDPSTCAQPREGSQMTFRILLHVDASGTVKLLKEVVEMQEKVPDPATGLPVFVLVASDRRLTEFDAASERDGRPFSRRISTSNYDIPAPIVARHPDGSTLRFELSIGAETRTNPFLHRYHPDHDNLDAQYQPLDPDLPEHANEVPTITRQMDLRFDTDCGRPDSPDCKAWATGSLRAGDYRETITGVHKLPIDVGGRFQIERVSVIDEVKE